MKMICCFAGCLWETHYWRTNSSNVVGSPKTRGTNANNQSYFQRFPFFGRRQTFLCSMYLSYSRAYVAAIIQTYVTPPDPVSLLALSLVENVLVRYIYISMLVWSTYATKLHPEVHYFLSVNLPCFKVWISQAGTERAEHIYILYNNLPHKKKADNMIYQI